MSKSRDIADSSATINYIDNVTSDVQNQIDTIDPLPSQTGQSGNYLTTDGSIASWAAVSGIIADEQAFTTSGTWTKPANASWVLIQAIGGGGGGAVGNFSGDGASGGGGGAFIERLVPASSVGATETITVGAGGAGNVGGGSGAVGGDSSFGSLVTAKGGKGGLRNNTLAAGLPHSTGNVTSTITGGVIVSYAGFGGVANAVGGNTVYGGAGGGGSTGTIRAGGTSVFGGDGGASGASSTGQNGTQPGGGGGGNDNYAAGNGGDGAAGNVRVLCF